jgi:hypothetical protein
VDFARRGSLLRATIRGISSRSQRRQTIRPESA